MEWVYIEDLSDYIGRKVEVRGWLYNKRSSGKLRFFLLRDGTGILQGTVYSPDKEHPLFKVYAELTQESSLILRGEIREDKRAPGGYE
ncbi:MAG: asparagine--tRNA ligase, partial [Candidatus Aminicenantes bacterium]|nr:asparagine--tRNA ligase [Candidatus Aminicenantes bacterium]